MIPLGRAQAEPENPPFLTPDPVKPHLRMFFWCLAIALGALQVWAHRNEVSPDSISYIELAWAAARYGLRQIVNAYWSPLYPFLLSLVFRCFHPAPQWEFTATHVLNFAVYLASLASFELFLTELLIVRRAAGDSLEESRLLDARTVRTWGYIFFLWAGYFWLGAAVVTPDLCISVLVYLAMAVLLRIRRGCGSGLLFAAFGGLLGLGYLAKAAMFPLSFVFLFSAFLLSWRAMGSLRVATLRALLAAGVFAAFALPLVLSLSLVKGRLTFGDSAKINYLEFVNRATRSAHWQGGPPGTGMPLHPTRKVFSDPDIYEFSAPIPGSYPPWYDPSYWYDGARPRFRLRDQLWAFFRAANMYLKIFSKSGALWVVFVALFWLFHKKILRWGGRIPGDWLILLPLAASLAMYAIVLVEFRYVAPFALLLLVWFLSKLQVAPETPPRLMKCFYAMVLLAPALAVFWMVLRDLQTVIRNEAYEPLAVAQLLHSMGIPPGADVGSIGSGSGAYWAHLAGVRIIAEIPDKDQARFLAADSVRKNEVLGKFSELGAKAVVTKNAAVASSMDGWQELARTHYYVWRAPANQAAGAPPSLR